MDFKTAAKPALYLSKDYAENIFRLLVAYKNISASEAASRLSMHIKTVQDFLEAMASFDILDKREVFEKKRPYFRYTLKTRRVTLDIDLGPLFQKSHADDRLSMNIRERKKANARFAVARNNQYISGVAIWTGKGRERKEKKINLTTPQGKFLYNLPFPNAKYLSVSEIMQIAGLEQSLAPEILDIVNVLIKYEVIENGK